MITENKNYTESILPYLSLPLVGSPFSGVSQGTPKRRLRPPVEGLSEIGDPTRGRDTAKLVLFPKYIHFVPRIIIHCSHYMATNFRYLDLCSFGLLLIDH